MFLLAASILALAAVCAPARAASAAAGRDSFRIAIFRSAGFPASENCPAGLTPDFIAAAARDTGRVLFVDEMELADPNSLSRENADILVLSYGENFPAFAFENIRRFVSAGGGLVTVAGIPFARPLERRKGEWALAPGAEHFYRRHLMPLGIRYYENEDAAGDTAAALAPGLLPCSADGT